MSIETNNKNYDIFDDYTCTIVKYRDGSNKRSMFFYANKKDKENIFVVDSVFDYTTGVMHDLVMFNINVTADVYKNAEKIKPFIDMYTQSHAMNIPFFEDNADEIALILGFIDEADFEVDDSYTVQFKINPVVNFDR